MAVSSHTAIEEFLVAYREWRERAYPSGLWKACTVFDLATEYARFSHQAKTRGASGTQLELFDG